MAALDRIRAICEVSSTRPGETRKLIKRKKHEISKPSRSQAMPSESNTGPDGGSAPSDDRAQSEIVLRVTSRRKGAYVRAARKKKQTLAAWCFELLDRESGHLEQ